MNLDNFRQGSNPYTWGVEHIVYGVLRMAYCASDLTPHRLTLHASRLTPHAPRLIASSPHRLTLHASRLTPHAPYLALFLFLFAIYLLTYTPRINSSDGQAMFATAESLVRRGSSGLDIEQIRWMDLQQGTFGLDGLLYSRKGIGVPVGLLPLTWLGLVVPWWGPVGAGLLFNALVTALTAVLLSAYLQELGFTRRTGLIVALTFGLTTLAWPYAKSLFSDPFSGLLLLAAAYALLKFNHCLLAPAPVPLCPSAPPLPRSPALFYPFLAGLLLGWNVATRYAEAIFVPIFGLLLLYYLFNASRLRAKPPLGTPHASGQSLPLGRFMLHALPPILAFSVPVLIIGLALITFNVSRYGDPFNTGYLPNETFSGVLWQGLIGQLFSPGRGLFLYCPIFLLSLLGFFPFFRRFRPEAITALSVILVHLFLYGQWFMWHGGYAWGPRFMVPTLPFWAIFLAPVVAQAFSSPPHRLTASSPHRLIFLTLAVLSLIPQLLSVAIDFGPFQNSLLDTGLPLFDPQTFFDPHYSPFAGAWKFVNLNSLDLAWTWQGQINGWLLVVLTINIILAAFNLRVSESASQRMAHEPDNESAKQQIANEPGNESANTLTATDQQIVANTSSRVTPSPPHLVTLLPCHHLTASPPHRLTLSLLTLLSTLGTVAFLLTYVHSLPALPLTQAVTALNEGVRPNDAVITNDPEAAQSFAELYKGRAPVLGLQSGGFPLLDPVTRRLNETITTHQQVWWLPNGTPPEESAVEQTLLAAGFRVRNDNFDGQRLVLFAYPISLDSHTVAPKAKFEQQITLLEAAYPPQTSAGAALPIELRWQAQAPLGQDYHVFIHLVNRTGQLIAQADSQPAQWTRPTTTWTAGETIVDRHGLWLPAQTAPGDYELRVGLYRPIDGQRLHLRDGEEWVSLKLTVQ